LSSTERHQVLRFLTGKPARVPLWLLILEAADFDPLRAQEIETHLERDWWELYLIYHHQNGVAQKEMQRKAKHGRN
jgi:hypothetical protein